MADTTPQTLDLESLSPGSRDATRVVPSLVLVWYPAAMQRVGEVLLCGAPGCVGRSRETTELVRQRPGETTPAGVLMADPHLSREHLFLEPDGQSVVVRNEGRRAVRHNGVPADRFTAEPGDLVEIDRVALFLVETRPVVLPGSTSLLYARFGEPDRHGLVGESPAMWAFRRTLDFVRGREGHVLLLGESGTGKELVARGLHADGPWVSRNAATLPPGIMDAELFGNLRGYPNPGMPDRPGLVGEADGGTLFLDELGELPEELQAKLLRVLDSGEYQRLGASRTQVSDFRLVGATNRDPEELKHDLHARLVHTLDLPSLNERRSDVPLLVRHLLRRIATTDPEMQRFLVDGQPRISARLTAALIHHDYTTHVRELEKLLWTVMKAFPDARLDETGDVSWTPPSREPSVDPNSLTREQVKQALDQSESRAEATRALGLRSRHQLTRLMRKHDLA